MKNFKEFIKTLMEPVVPEGIKAQPVHGEHSKPKNISCKDKSDIKEDIGNGPRGDSKYTNWLHTNENSHLGDSETQVHIHLDQDEDTFRNHPDSRALHKYTDYSHDTNKELINQHFKQPSLYAHSERAKLQHLEHVDRIDNALYHSNLAHDVHVFHGTTGFHPGKEAAKHPEGKILLPAYTSTSLSKSTAAMFATPSIDDSGKPVPAEGHIIHIHLKKGQKAHYIGSNSSHANEKEMLLPRHTTLKIHPTPTSMDDNSGVKRHIWHAHVTD